MSWVILTAAALVVGTTTTASAETLSGPARVIDGDTIELAGERIRLHGIDAPEGRQYCTAEGTEYPCGDMAAAHLVNLTLGKHIECNGQERDRYKRPIAVCYADGVDLNGALVRAGWAVAYRRCSSDYVDEEDEARSNRVGMWPGTFDMPWEWRRKK